MQNEFPLRSRLRGLLLIPPMALKKCERDLHKNLPNEVLIDPLLLLLALLNELSEIAAFAMLHDYVKSGVLLVNNLIVAPNDILMLKFPQDIDLVDQLIEFLLPKLSIINLLPDHLLRRWEVLHQRNLSERPLADVLLYKLVLIHFLYSLLLI